MNQHVLCFSIERLIMNPFPDYSNPSSMLCGHFLSLETACLFLSPLTTSISFSEYLVSLFCFFYDLSYPFIIILFIYNINCSLYFYINNKIKIVLWVFLESIYVEMKYWNLD